MYVYAYIGKNMLHCINSWYFQYFVKHNNLHMPTKGLDAPHPMV